MEIFTLLETLEDILEKSKKVPFTNKAVVDKDEIVEIIQEIRLKLPDELKQAKWIKEERQRILLEAQKEADGVVKEAESRIISMIDEHEITRKAYDQKNEIIETFKSEYISQIMGTIGENIHIPLFANGYDSPIAREIMIIMYSYLRNKEFIEKAKKEGVWNKLMFVIIEETNKITDKYCDADVQECIEYFNFPEKPVVTSRRCPTCGSRRVFCEDCGEYECMDCGCQWRASHGRNTYSSI